MSTTRESAAPPAPREGVAGPASRVSLATAASRLLGLVRESVFAALVGSEGAASAFVLAFRIPNLLRDFFAEGALSSAFVPTFARARVEQGEAAAWDLARRVAGTVGAVTGVLALLGILFAPGVVTVVAPSAGEDVRELTVSLTRIMCPFLPLAALAAVAMGVLNTHRRYFVPALAPAFFNVVAVAGGAAMLLAGWGPDVAVTGWAVLVLVGGLAQVLVQVPLLLRVGWRGPPVADLAFRDPGVRTVARRMGPVVIGLAGTNVMLVIVTALASRDDAWPAWLNFAFRLVHLPIGIVGVAVGTVVLAAGSRTAAAGDRAGVDDLVRRGLRLAWFLALPAAVGLFVLADPIVRLVYERGRFTGTASVGVADALRAYALGVVFYAGVKATAPLFLARGDTRTPMHCSLLGIAATVAVALSTVGPLGHVGLALAVSFGSATNFLSLRFVGRRRHGPDSSVGGAFLGRVVLAAAAMGALGWAATRWGPFGDTAGVSLTVEGAATLALVAVLAALYFVLAARLGVEEARGLRARLGRRGRS